MSLICCLTCNHKCHCIGSGFYVSSTECGCGCFDCTCKGLKILEETNMLKKIWNKIKGLWNRWVEWMFNGFYK